MQVDAMTVSTHLDSVADQFLITAVRHLQAACAILDRSPQDFVVADERLPPWDLAVLRGRVTNLVLADPETHAGEIAWGLERRLPRKQPPRF
jgi:hypothetical protein